MVSPAKVRIQLSRWLSLIDAMVSAEMAMTTMESGRTATELVRLGEKGPLWRSWR